MTLIFERAFDALHQQVYERVPGALEVMLDLAEEMGAPSRGDVRRDVIVNLGTCRPLHDDEAALVFGAEPIEARRTARFDYPTALVVRLVTCSCQTVFGVVAWSRRYGLGRHVLWADDVDGPPRDGLGRRPDPWMWRHHWWAASWQRH